MNLRIMPALVVMMMLMTLATTLHAQRAGFEAGIAPAAPPAPPVPGVISSPVQPFITAPVQPAGLFGVAPPIVPPIITTTYSPIYSNFQSPAVAVGGLQILHPSVFYGGAGVTVIVPNGIVITNPAVIVQQPQGQFFGGLPVVARSGNPVQPPSIGMPRAQVIQQFGSPVTSVITQHNETMYFTGGVTVVLQDGKVVTPNRPD